MILVLVSIILVMVTLLMKVLIPTSTTYDAEEALKQAAEEAENGK